MNVRWQVYAKLMSRSGDHSGLKSGSYRSPAESTLSSSE